MIINFVYFNFKKISACRSQKIVRMKKGCLNFLCFLSPDFYQLFVYYFLFLPFTPRTGQIIKSGMFLCWFCQFLASETSRFLHEFVSGIP